MLRENQIKHEELNKIYIDEKYAYVNLKDGIFIKAPNTEDGLALLDDAMQNIDALNFDLRLEKYIFIDYDKIIDSEIFLSTNWVGDENDLREATEEENIMFALG